METERLVHENKDESQDIESESRDSFSSPRLRSTSVESSISSDPLDDSSAVTPDKNHAFNQKRNSVFKLASVVSDHVMRRGSSSANLNLKMDFKAR